MKRKVKFPASSQRIFSEIPVITLHSVLCLECQNTHRTVGIFGRMGVHWTCFEHGTDVNFKIYRNIRCSFQTLACMGSFGGINLTSKSMRSINKIQGTRKIPTVQANSRWVLENRIIFESLLWLQYKKIKELPFYYGNNLPYFCKRQSSFQSARLLSNICYRYLKCV